MTPEMKRDGDKRRRCGGFLVACMALGPVPAVAAEQITASATVRCTSDDCTTTQADAEHLRRLDEGTSKVFDIDRRFPRPMPPRDDELRTAVGVAAPGIIELDDGTRLRIEGVTCDQAGVDNLSKHLVGEDTSLIVRIIDTDASPPLAMIWTQMLLSEITPGAGPARSHSWPAETALTSGWCEPGPAGTAMMRDRYRALWSTFHEGQ